MTQEFCDNGPCNLKLRPGSFSRRDETAVYSQAAIHGCLQNATAMRHFRFVELWRQTSFSLVSLFFVIRT